MTHVGDLNNTIFTDLLSGLLAVYSPSAHERAASAYMAEQMLRLGYDHAFVDESDSVVGILGQGSRTLVLLGHIDTVIGFIPPTIHDGKLYGRGAVDAKGPLATFVAAASLAGACEGWRLVVIGATEEEAASSRGARHALSQYQPELCIIGEPSQWDRVTLGYKGRVLLDYRLVSRLSHTAGRDRNAPEQAIAFWNAVLTEAAAFNGNREKVFDQLLPSLRTISTEDDGFHQTVTMTLGFRLPLDMSPADLKPRLLQHLSPTAEFSFRGDEVAFKADKNTPLVRLFNNAIRDQGGRPAHVYKTGTSDMNVVGPVWNCPIVAYGPGDSALDHTPEEHIILDEYYQAIQVLAHVLRHLND